MSLSCCLLSVSLLFSSLFNFSLLFSSSFEAVLRQVNCDEFVVVAVLFM